MNKKNRPLYLGLMAGLTLIGLGISYESLWCDPRSELAENVPDPQALERDFLSLRTSRSE